ncbi:pilus (MSHA type) biogenesis protein MshL [Undibacterium sp. Ji50W]|uniref:pilus (MSHA type) biogenesis protein MshL n=1 Tax=Undibacterium sp. Ji50W TaxID=3413041 RepID=UPI003BF40DFB
MTKIAISFFCLTILSACGTQPVAPSTSHIKESERPYGKIPEPVRQSAVLAKPKATPKVETYSVSVYKVAIQPLLFALARDAKLNVDIHPGIEGEVTLNALDQSLPQLLTRISKQVDMRFELDGPNLIVLPDAPFLRNYKIDYVNVSRDTNSKVSIATQISTATGTGASAGSGTGDNNSTTSVSNTSNNRFWATLVENIKDTLRETDKILPDTMNGGTAAVSTGATSPANTTGRAGNASNAANPASPAASRPSTYREAASVIANPETGLIAIRATSRQHEKIQEFLDLVMSSAKRQVMIEATVIEVQLNDQYQQGINWSSLRTSATEGPSISVGQVGGAPLPSGIKPGASQGLFNLNYLKPLTGLGNLAVTIQLLESFGKVKVLSSPKISVLNNQTALLKVVDNRVYFTITATTQQGSVGTPSVTTYTSSLNTVPVGFVMSVTPQIADNDEVTINVRPSISRIIGYVQDPNPALAQATVPVVSNVPVIQTREMESVLKVSSGQIAVMGGLMQDTINNLKDEVPGVGRIPLLGNALSFRNETTNKSELVIFMRPIVVKDASISGDYKNYRYLLPNDAPLNNEPYTETPPEQSKAGVK